MVVALFNRYRADRLHRQAQACSRAGDEDAALALYAKCVVLDPGYAGAFYNMGLIHKYRGEWEQSFASNARAYELSPGDEASRWNLAIAATALRRWSVARRAWRDNGLDVPGGEGPITMDLGMTPVRLHPEGSGEVVWAQRIDPVRARIISIPFPESGFRLGDVVLHDGAAAGARVVDGREYPVFNVLELFESSGSCTYVLELRASTADRVASLERVANDVGITMEDWTADVRSLCRQCSEGIPHDTHDHLPEPTWQVERSIGLAAVDRSQIDALVEACSTIDGLVLGQLTLAGK
ncbi:hypothetical protein [Dyella sp.]|uniref:tetratricopeptide repeat protein n=1 Tax=Dyella sp. TaxID=1869338 RepID=UPI002D7928DF|nr:hypothetical protein [Dyella sp.]HET6432892.1 hypothetical protein [Dyella sp.]